MTEIHWGITENERNGILQTIDETKEKKKLYEKAFCNLLANIFIVGPCVKLAGSFCKLAGNFDCNDWLVLANVFWSELGNLFLRLNVVVVAAAVEFLGCVDMGGVFVVKFPFLVVVVVVVVGNGLTMDDGIDGFADIPFSPYFIS